jgi:hypothetical protein
MTAVLDAIAEVIRPVRWNEAVLAVNDADYEHGYCEMVALHILRKQKLDVEVICLLYDRDR